MASPGCATRVHWVEWKSKRQRSLRKNADEVAEEPPVVDADASPLHPPYRYHTPRTSSTADAMPIRAEGSREDTGSSRDHTAYIAAADTNSGAERERGEEESRKQESAQRR